MLNKISRLRSDSLKNYQSQSNLAYDLKMASSEYNCFRAYKSRSDIIAYGDHSDYGYGDHGPSDFEDR